MDAFIQTQAKEALTPHRLKNFKEEKVFKNLYLPIKKTLSNTLIPLICWKNTADYLIDKTQWWDEEDSGVQFLDLSEIMFSKQLYHFLSSTIKAEEDFTSRCWEKIH